MFPVSGNVVGNEVVIRAGVGDLQLAEVMVYEERDIFSKYGSEMF